MSNKSKHFLLQACKILVILSCLSYLGWQLRLEKFNWNAVNIFLSDLPTSLYFLLPLLSILSWFVESYKWKLLVQDLRSLRFRESVIQNFTAQAASFITPLKAGEFAAKAFYFPYNIRKKVLKAVLVGNLSQMAVTVILGTAGIALLIEIQFIATVIIAGGAGLVILLSRSIFQWFDYRGANIATITGISFFRYVIFSSCWILVLLTISNVSILLILGSITAMYLAASIVPTIQLFDVFLKWSIASFFVGYLDISLESMTAIVAIIWLNNTVLPVLLGCILLAFQRFPNVATV
ncbi:hypothetical protein [Nonlabens antarcticus]|uniref:hypothetical protein n=1 Tax=Nonlabens antarcticus TaxID=392714 RepID=UPI001891D865|nr:hypothetical protein [Nonlabens antarcticus]